MPDTDSIAKTDEVWRPVVGNDFYEVSNLGRVRSLDRTTLGRAGSERKVRGRVLAQQTNGVYPTVVLSQYGEATTELVHGLVAAAFIGPRPEGAEVLHDDGDSMNCREGNLRYGTSKENKQDTLRHGRRLFGEYHQNCTVTDAQVDELRSLPRGAIKNWADRHGVSRGHAYNIRSRNRR